MKKIIKMLYRASLLKSVRFTWHLRNMKKVTSFLAFELAFRLLGLDDEILYKS